MEIEETALLTILIASPLRAGQTVADFPLQLQS